MPGEAAGPAAVQADDLAELKELVKEQSAQIHTLQDQVRKLGVRVMRSPACVRLQRAPLAAGYYDEAR